MEPIQDIKEQQAGVLVHPSQLPVSLQTGPILGANFGQVNLNYYSKSKGNSYFGRKNHMLAKELWRNIRQSFQSYG